MTNMKFVLPMVAVFVLTVGLTACGGSGGELSQDDFRSYCSNLKSCVGDQQFNAQYDSVDDCASSQAQLYDGYEGECASLATDAGRCVIQNFECDGGQQSQSICEEERSEFTSTCEMGQ